MRKPRDYDAELKALEAKARHLRQKRIVQLGELVIACDVDSLPPEQLAGALLSLKNVDAKTMEGWRQRGAAFFQRAPRQPARCDDHVPGGMLPLGGDTPSA